MDDLVTDGDERLAHGQPSTIEIDVAPDEAEHLAGAACRSSPRAAGSPRVAFYGPIRSTRVDPDQPSRRPAGSGASPFSWQMVRL